MARSIGTVKSLFAEQMEKLAAAYSLLRKVMPDYFLRHVSNETLHYLLPLIVDIDKKSGMQMIETPDSLLLAYLKDRTHNPVYSSLLVAGRRVLRTMVHESIPFGPEKSILIVEQMSKERREEALPPRYPFKTIAAAARKGNEKIPEEMEEAAERLNWNEVFDLTPEKIAGRLRLALKVQDGEHSRTEFEKVSAGIWRMTMAVATVARCEGFYAATLELLARRGYQVKRAYLREFTHAAGETDFFRKAVRINTFYLQSSGGGFRPSSLRQLGRELNELSWGMRNDLFESELCRKHDFPYQEVNLLRAAAEFVHSQLAFVDRNAFTPGEVARFMATYPGVLRKMCDYFNSKFDPRSPRRGEAHFMVLRKLGSAIDEINSGMPEKDARVRIVFHGVLNFFARILKSNFHSDCKSALAFRLDPAFMEDYSWSESYRNAFQEVRPFGVFFFWRREISGFQIRFSDIARGGWRTVVPRPSGNALESGDGFEQAQCELFRECYVLAHTQHRKNKDICEGGSKLVTLYRGPLGKDFHSGLWAAQRGVFNAFLSLINYDDKGKLKDSAVVDLTGASEIIEIGPDENMFDPMIEWMGQAAANAGYILGSGIISGKADTGINHKTYGVTSFGVYQYLLRTLKFLNIDPYKDEFSVKISGGPFGDVAGNLLKFLNARDGRNFVHPKLRIVAVTDGPAALFDPSGVDRDELSRLIHRENLDNFDPAKLRGEGAYMLVNAPESTADGDVYRMVAVEDGHALERKIERGLFMRMFQNNICCPADVFLPCGGRPRTLNEENFRDYLLPDGTPSSRAIVEGANSFLTPGARVELQKLGIAIIKDSSANKCGVITSSFEILSGLLLSPAEFKDAHAELVKEVMKKLESCARREAEWLFVEHEHTGIPLTELSDSLADRINALGEEFKKTLHANPDLIFPELILEHLPAFFQRMPDRIERIPGAYREAIVAVETALRVIFERESPEDTLRRLAGRRG